MLDNFDSSKLFNLLGLFFDLVGVIIFFVADYRLRKIDLYTDQSLEKQDFVDVYEATKQGIKLEQTDESKLAEKMAKKMPLKKALSFSRIGLGLLVIGFLLQIIGNIIS